MKHTLIRNSLLIAALTQAAAVSAAGDMSKPAKPAMAGSAESTLSVSIDAVSRAGSGQSLGSVSIKQTEYGTVFTPDLAGLEPGVHGFHVHEKASCAPSNKDGKITPAGGAGSHYDPEGTDQHGTPWGEGHLGDLPALYVDEDGNASYAVLAPRIKLSDLQGRALVIHAGGDNYSDKPKPLGGGGERVACGVIEK